MFAELAQWFDADLAAVDFGAEQFVQIISDLGSRDRTVQFTAIAGASHEGEAGLPDASRQRFVLRAQFGAAGVRLLAPMFGLSQTAGVATTANPCGIR